MLKVALEMGLKYKITKKYKKFQKSEWKQKRAKYFNVWTIVYWVEWCLNGYNLLKLQKV